MSIYTLLCPLLELFPLCVRIIFVFYLPRSVLTLPSPIEIFMSEDHGHLPGSPELHVVYTFLWTFKERLGLSMDARGDSCCLSISALARILNSDEVHLVFSNLIVALLKGVPIVTQTLHRIVLTIIFSLFLSLSIYLFI